MRLLWTIYLASLCSLLLCSVLLTVIVSYRQAEDSLRRLRDEQRLLAITAASQVETGYYDQVWPFEMLSGIARDPQFVAWHIADGNGAVVLSSGTAEPGLAIEVAPQPQLVRIPHTDREFWVVPMRMRDGTHAWQFRLGYHTRAIDAQRASIVATNALIGLGLAIVFLGTSLYFTHRVLRPLNSLTRAVSEMERGNLDVSLPDTGTDELGQLVAGFSAMVGSIVDRDAKIQEHLGSLERARGDLEMRVEQRTSELHASGARTRAIIQYAVTRDIDHIKHVVQSQQSYAKIAVDFRELVSLEELMEDAVRISSSAIGDDSVDLVREYEPTPPVNIDRHKVVHILVNLISNAKQAVAGMGRARRIRLCIGPAGGASVRVAVSTTGSGSRVRPCPASSTTASRQSLTGTASACTARR
jgi:signal transduction histidine kinase